MQEQSINKGSKGYDTIIMQYFISLLHFKLYSFNRQIKKWNYVCCNAFSLFHCFSSSILFSGTDLQCVGNIHLAFY